MWLLFVTVSGGGVAYAGTQFYRYHKRHQRRKQFDLLLNNLPQVESLTDANRLAEEKAPQRLLASIVAFGVSAGSLFVYPPLRLVSLPLIAYAFSHVFLRAYQAVVDENRIRMDVLDATFFVGALLTDHFVAVSLGGCLINSSWLLLSRTEDHTSKQLVTILEQQPSQIWLWRDGVEVQVALDSLQRGEVVVVTAGEMIPVDGTIVEGNALVDQHLLTGEAQPVEKGVGESVFVTTMVLTGRICIQVEQTGQETVAAKISQILNQTRNFKLDIQSKWIEFADSTTPFTLGISGLALVTLGPTAAVTALYACFGYYMRLIAPVGMLNFLHLAFQKGVLIKDGRVFDLLQGIDTVVFDKTGTLTLDQPQVRQIHTMPLCYSKDNLPLYNEALVLTYAAAAEYRQTHPIALAILAEARHRGVTIPAIEEAHYEVGYGIKVQLEGRSVRVGSSRFMALEEIPLPPLMAEIHANSLEQGYSLVMVAVEKQVIGAIELQTRLRPEATHLVQFLRQRGLELYIISGDHEKPTQRLAKQLDIEHYFAETLPEDKATIVAQLQQSGKSVCFIGDGINDSIALRKADVSISLAGASTVANDTAQIVLLKANLQQISNLFELTDYYQNNMDINVLTTIIPGVIVVGGVFLFDFGVLSAITINYSGLLVGMGNASLPLVLHD